MLNKQQLNQCMQELIRRKNDVQKLIKDQFGLENAAIHESTSELSSYDNHPADNASELYERQKDLALNEHEKKELTDIEYALTRMGNHAYGNCVICDVDIPAERLLAMPTTTKCVKHAEQHIVQQRPIEEVILSQNIDEEEVEDDDQTMFDGEDAWQAVELYGSSDGPSDFYDTVKDYQEMFYHSEELIGGTELLENFLLADSDGNYIGVNENHEQYEDYLDETTIYNN